MQKNRFFLLCISIFLLLAVPFSFFAQEKTVQSEGYERCLNLLVTLERNDFFATKIPLLNNDSEDFPFNIQVDFFRNTDYKFQENEISSLYFIFHTEEVSARYAFILSVLNSLQNTARVCDVHVVFSYGDKIGFYSDEKICGTKALISSIVDSDSSAVICISLENKITSIVPGSNGDCSPAWLTSLTATAFSDNQIFFIEKGGFLSSFYRLDFMQTERRTGLFLQSGIPSCAVELGLQRASQETESRFVNFFSSIAQEFSPEETTVWDRHSRLLQIGRFTISISETFTIILFLIFTAAALFVMCELTFLLRFSGTKISMNVIKKWHLIPVLALATTIAFFIGQAFSFGLYKIFNANFFLLASVKIIFGFLLVSIAYLFTLRTKKAYSAEVYSYLLTVVSLLNIFIFSFIDISFFYLFAVEYIIISISRPVKRTVTLSLVFILLALPFVPYAYQLIKYGTQRFLNTLLYANFFVNAALSIAFMPFEFIWLRILSRLNFVWKNVSSKEKTFIKQNLIVILIAVFLFALILVILSIKIPDQYKRNINIIERISYEASEEEISILYSDSVFFEDTNRTITVYLHEKTENVSVSVKGKTQNAVIYSSNSYTTGQEQFTDTFLLPSWPPNHIQFNYIANAKDDSMVIVTTTAVDSEKHQIITQKKELFIPAKKEGGS